MPPSQTGTHDLCREAVCAACFVKTPKKKISAGEEAMVKKYAKPEYDSKVKSYPAGLCSYCRTQLNACKRGMDWEEEGRQHPRLKWDQFQLRFDRYDESKHNAETCQICIVAKWSPVGKKNVSPNSKPKVLNKGETESPPAKKIEEKKVCIDCKQVTGKGIPHNCTKNAAKRNLSEMIAKESTAGQEQILSESL